MLMLKGEKYISKIVLILGEKNKERGGGRAD